MFRSLLATLKRDTRGSVAIYVAAVGAVVIGIGALGIDVGRMAVLRSQIQNAADAAAMSAAGELNGLGMARARATDVATDAILNTTGLTNGVSEFVVQSTEFLSEIVPTAVPATSDANANFVRVSLEPRDIDLLFRPVLDLLTGGSASPTATLAATATAGGAPVMCHIPPVMVCNLDEDFGSSYDLLDPSNIGRQLVMKEGPGGGASAPGNYGTLCTPDGDCGANAIGDALANPEPQMCYTDVLLTAPGVKTQKTRDGMNARMDTGKHNPKNPARNIMSYPRDSNMVDESAGEPLGNGSWDPRKYWTDTHSTAFPPALKDATRYQVYLYELGETYARNGAHTLYPLPEGIPAGYTTVSSFGKQVPPAGEPKSKPYPDPRRRLVTAAVLSCQSQDVKGSGEYRAYGRYIELLLTEVVAAPPNASIYGEIVGRVTADSHEDMYGNVQLFD